MLEAMLSIHPVDHALAAAPSFRSGATVLVAVSGGPDSMALLAAASAHAGATIVAAHFDHQIREDSARDLDAVRAFADARGVRVIAGAGDVPLRARRERISMETAARNARYAFLWEAADRADADWIATAHTRSDHVETVLMRVLRGAGERGLAGIAREREGVVRPLLDVTRSDTLDYCTRYGIAFVNDPSNHDRRHARNAVRHDVLPALRRVYPGLDDALLRTAQRAEATLAAARLMTNTRLARLHHESGAWVLPLDAFAGLDDVEASILIGDAMHRIGCLEDIATTHYERVLALARGDHTGASASLPGATVRRDHDALVWRVGGIESGDEQHAVPLQVPGNIELNGWIVTASLRAGGTRRLAGSEACSTRFHEARFQPARAKCMSGEQASLPATRLVVRPPRPGDRIQPFGMRGTKKLSDVFIDRKVPHRERARCVVVEAGGEILWVPGVIASEATRVTGSETEIVEITAVRSEVNP